MKREESYKPKIDKTKLALYLLKWYKKPSSFWEDVYSEKPYPYQENFMDRLNDWENFNRVLVCAAGGTGKTKLFACSALYSSTVLAYHLKQPINTIIISGSRDQALVLYDHTKKAIQSNPILSQLVEGEPLMSYTRFNEVCYNSDIRAVARSLTSIQSRHAHYAIYDEAGLLDDFTVRDRNRVVGPMNPNRIVLGGTPTIYDSEFVRLWEDRAKYPNWVRVSWTAMDCPNINAQVIEEARKEGDEYFNIFFLGQPTPLLNTVFDTRDIKACSEGIERFDYDPNLPVNIGIDWGHEHPCAIVIVQRKGEIINPIYMVLEAKLFKEQLFEKIHDFVESKAKVYPSLNAIYTDASDVGENQRLYARGLPVVPKAFNQQKASMLSRLMKLMRDKHILIPDEFVELKYQLKTYTLEKKKNDDLVDALMLAISDQEAESSSGLHYVIAKPKRLYPLRRVV